MKKMSFVEAVRVGLKKSFDVTGTATRREFWYFLLFRVLVGVVTIQFDQILLSSAEDFAADAPPEAGPLTTIAAVALLVPSITVQVRRMRDAGWSAWWMALWLIPIAGVFAAAIGISEFLSSAPMVDEAALNEVFLRFSAPFVLLTAAVQVFLLVLSLLPSKSREQGNKYAPEA